MKGMVFDIQRYALHDGPGIRTVIFLKGCPLNCKWCSNPESISGKPQLGYLSSNCNDCGKCVESCPQKAFEITNSKLSIKLEKCTACGVCIDECPQNALKIFGFAISSENIIKEVAKDLAYFDNSGGGITLSGGEPLFQPVFSNEILLKAKELGIHTAVETSGFVRRNTLAKIAEFVDLWLFDYKISEVENHLYYIGKTQKIILQNLSFLNSKNSNIHLRCIVLPGINDNIAHLKSIADLMEKNSSIKQIEIMPFHRFGECKYKQIGKSIRPFSPEVIDNKISERWKDTLQSMGYKNVIIN